jgi:hypothetical protein
MDDRTGAWLDIELAGCSLADERLTRRLRKVLAQIGDAMGQSLPLACQDWANTKAAYRFFSNDRVSEAEILSGHFLSTRDRMAAHNRMILMLHDTTEFSYQRERPEAIGITKSVNSGRDKEGRVRSHTVCGIMMHSSLAVTMDGLPWDWPRSSSGPVTSSREQLRSSARSTRRGFPLSIRKASDGWKIFGNPRR